MDKRIDRILKDLYRIDPALREGEEEMRKTIRKMLEDRPDARMDRRFEKELKARLLENFSKGRKRGRILGFAMRPAFSIPLGAVAAASLVLVLFLRTGLGPKETEIVNSEMPAQADRRTTHYDHGATVEQLSSNGAPAQTAIRTEDSSLMSGRAAAPGEAEEFLYEEKDLPSVSFDSPMKRTGDFTMSKEKSVTEAFADEVDLLAGIQEAEREFNTEGYDRIAENPFLETMKEPLSTFSIDVDTASYANVRRYLDGGSLPPADAVRIEELVNYFSYSYPEPEGDDPMAWSTEMGPCPWQEGHYLLRIGLQARRIPEEELPPSNLVFLIDVSGSMSDENKLPLVKEALGVLVAKLRKEDRISLVVYAGAAGLVLQPTSGAEKTRILKAIDDLEAGGSTAGGEGIELAYASAKAAFIRGGNNRVILASDGDFNVGASSDAEMVRLIEQKRRDGIFLTVLGFGMGNYKDSKMQKLADYGNGNYAYIDSMDEARKVLDRQMAGTLHTLAKDVKIQIEFNPARVHSYRLIGYEKRILAARDFDDDAKDAGELGAGHTVTALYQIVPASGAPAPRSDLRYQQSSTTAAAASDELMNLKFRYKEPDGEVSKLIQTAVPWAVAEQPSADHSFAAAVAEWGLLLRDSEHKGRAAFLQVLALALPSAGAQGPDGEMRADFLRLVSVSRALME